MELWAHACASVRWCMGEGRVSQSMTGKGRGKDVERRFHTFRLLDNFLNYFVGDAQVLDVVAPDVALRDFPELVPVARSAHHVAQRQIHPDIAIDQDAVVSFAVLELDQHDVVLARTQKRERQLQYGRHSQADAKMSTRTHPRAQRTPARLARTHARSHKRGQKRTATERQGKEKDRETGRQGNRGTGRQRDGGR